VSKHQDLREWAPVEYDPTDDPGNPYQHVLDDDTDDVTEDLRLGLSVYGMRRIGR
jgi:hypothetical protein